LETQGTEGLRQQLEAALSGTYRLERELGGGGMSRVFVAEDARLGRRVVIKVLAPDLAAGLSPERFEREIRLAARLQHPNVVPLLAAGERGGLAYYTMPYVEGESLRARLSREGSLPVEAAVPVLRDVARALAYAHAHGVVHRDVKPDNVLVTAHAAVVLDFGIAKAVHAARTEGAEAADGTTAGFHGVGDATLTRAGMSLGTPAYMAPEQATGDPAADHRADLYAWGVLAYELLAGAPPFAGRPAHQLVAAHLAVRAPHVPPALAGLVMQCLEKDPARRPRSAEDVLRGLEAVPLPSGEQSISPAPRPALRGWRRTLVLGIVALLVATLVGALAVRARQPVAPTRPVLAVLPFENLGPAADAYFADGLTEEVRARLAGVAGLQVIGGRSAAQYRGSAKSPRQIARELGATHLLTATVRWDRSGGDGAAGVRVSPELVRAADQATVWAEPVAGPLDDVFALQARVAERVAGALDVALGDRAPSSVVVPATPTRSAAAYDAYLRGLAHASDLNRFSAPDRRAAIDAFERAVTLDPGFAAAHARLAVAYVYERDFGGGSGGTVARAHVSAVRAMALDSSSMEARLAKARVLTASDDPEGALREFQAAARAAPSSAEVDRFLGETLEKLGRLPEAVPHYERATRMEPRWADTHGSLAGALDRLYRHADAIPVREREVALANHPWAAVFGAASHLLWQADTVGARRVLAQGDPGQVQDLLTRLPSHFAGRAIWVGVVPQAVLAAKDTITRAAYVRGDWGTPDLYHLMKARHFVLTGRPARARAHADSVITLLEPRTNRGAGTGVLIDLFTPRATLAEAYAYAGRMSDAAREIDRYVDDQRRRRESRWALRSPYALVTAAYVDVLVGRRDLAVARLEEALRLPAGSFISRALLRADPSWAPLRGHPGFEQLIAGR
jgi:serine/threonine-protein kinase